MTPGTFFLDKHFRFQDGEEGQKILVALGTSHGVTIVVKTTIPRCPLSQRPRLPDRPPVSEFPSRSGLLLPFETDVGLSGRVL